LSVVVVLMGSGHVANRPSLSKIAMDAGGAEFGMATSRRWDYHCGYWYCRY
jgi:hypothetical protein